MNNTVICFTEDLNYNEVTKEAWSLPYQSEAIATTLATSIILLLFMAVGIPWNIGVLVKLIRDKFYKEPSSFLLFNLALVDLLTCLLVMPFQTAPGLAGGRYKLGQSDYQLCQTCYAGVMIIICLLYVSIHILAVMSVDRLVYIVRPLHYHKIVTVPRIAVAILVIWILCVIMATPPLFQFGVIAFSQNIGTCSLILSTESTTYPAYYYLLLLVLEVTLPLIAIFTANIWLLVVLCRTSKKRLIMSQVSISKRRPSTQIHNKKAKSVYNKQQLRIMKMFGSIVISNIITWVPIAIAIVPILIISTPPGVYSMIFLCFLSQSVIHPVLESCLIGTHDISSCIHTFNNCNKKRTNDSRIRTISRQTTRISTM